jgi:PBSX family phage terminase large subunit
MSTPMTSSLVKPTAVFKALDWSIPAWKDRAPVLLCSGSAGGGKSKFAAEKVNAYMKRFPGSTGLMLRKVKDSMTNSTVLFFKFNVLGAELGKSVWHIESKSRFEYANGSILSYGGMWNEEQREALRSVGQDGGLGICWMEEATRFIEDDFNELIPRMRETKGDFRQMILTTNPSHPNHWIYKRLILERGASVYYSGALDNPNNPPEYIQQLQSLTGILKKRLVEGLWVQAEGVVYDNFSPDENGNVTERAEYDPSKPVIWGVDDGYAYGQGPGTLSYHPRVILFAQETAQGGMIIFDEYYACQELGETSIENCLAKGYPPPEQVYIDSSAAELRGRLWAKGYYVVPSTHEVVEGIKNVRRMICDGHGMRLLLINPRCKQVINELLNYQYDEHSTASKAGERKPLKLDDHGGDVLRYLCHHLRYETSN